MFAFWLGIAIIAIRSLTPFMRELKSPGLESLKQGWFRRILPRWFDLLGLSLIVGNFWLSADFDARSYGLGLLLAAIIAFGAFMLRLELFGWLLLWHGARQRVQERAAQTGQGE